MNKKQTDVIFYIFAAVAKLGGAALSAAKDSALQFVGACVKAGMDFDASIKVSYNLCNACTKEFLEWIAKGDKNNGEEAEPHAGED